ncbi:MAG: hypothetical protein FWG43_06345, partial [Clostridiales bacterium]|nr:hypothetical protein [Clostridiales bacterium]
NPISNPASNPAPTLAPTPAAEEFAPLSVPEVTIKPDAANKNDTLAVIKSKVAANKDRILERPAKILALHNAGLDRLHIAQELSITLSEVDLVLGLAAQM